ncbi:phage integrase N-terminal SAM-like domain-containing protein [Xanthomonas arboricola]|uniref:phage integrase N-terminal SAM-like domain-containing protein n=1 Tax=Xanthomonas arboricola TaxID=56448 RepID=UPI001EE845FC|nr:phage integrase N-terminal SAM-like domain-containing protein [Xanthomonas arboricola]
MKYAPKNNGVTARPPTRLLDQVRDRPRVRHCSLHTEQAYLSWIRRFTLTSGKRYLVQMGQVEVETFLTC